MSDDTRNVIFGPDGASVISGKPLTREEWRAQVGEWFVQFATVSDQLDIGNHCTRCKSPLVGKNAPSDPVFTMACNCREFIWRNRDYRETSKARVM